MPRPPDSGGPAAASHATTGLKNGGFFDGCPDNRTEPTVDCRGLDDWTLNGECVSRVLRSLFFGASV